MKLFIAALFVVLAGGCASNPHDDRYVDHGQIKGERVRIPPCNPFRADDLMDWANELDTEAYHDRSARTDVDAQGWVRCSSKEAAGSRSTR